MPLHKLRSCEVDVGILYLWQCGLYSEISEKCQFEQYYDKESYLILAILKSCRVETGD